MLTVTVINSRGVRIGVFEINARLALRFVVARLQVTPRFQAKSFSVVPYIPHGHLSILHLG